MLSNVILNQFFIISYIYIFAQSVLKETFHDKIIYVKETVLLRGHFSVALKFWFISKGKLRSKSFISFFSKN